MELISTVKMKKAQENLFSLRPFALATLSVLEQISEDDSIFAPYTQIPDSSKELVVLIASNKGLCGGYNVNIFKKLIDYIRTDDGTPYPEKYEYVTVGKRAREFVLRTGQTLVADFTEQITDPINPTDVRMLVRMMLDSWGTKRYSKISVLYSHYASAITQIPVMKTMFPFHKNDIHAFLHRIARVDLIDQKARSENKESFIIEPNPGMVLEYALPLILDAMLHETMLEAHASEHASRMVAMKNAKDAAGKKAKALTLVYNKARQ